MKPFLLGSALVMTINVCAFIQAGRLKAAIACCVVLLLEVITVIILDAEEKWPKIRK
jgi:hypothetical protein